MTMTSDEHHHNDQLPRSVNWRSWLGVFQGLNQADWVKQAGARRDAYTGLLAKFTAAPVNDDDDLQINNPLSQHQQSSWSQFFRSADLQSTIDLDLVRTHPTKPFFQSPQTQSQMRNVLFVWALLHPNVSYRQGMNELLSPLLMVRSNDAECADDYPSEDIRVLLDKRFVEHDAFAMFEVLMSNMSNLFISDPPAGAENQPPPIVARSEYVQNVLLRDCDAELYVHLTKIGVQPQLYGLRWLRLLLAREFHLENIFVLWDAIFSSSFYQEASSIYSLPFVDYLCVAMLQFVRKDLLSGDHSTCIRRLLSYPPVEDISVLISRAEHYLKDSGVSSFVVVPLPTKPESGTLSGEFEHISAKSSPGKNSKFPQIPKIKSDSASNNELLGTKLEDLISIMQREIRKGHLECDQGILLQCIAKIKLIKDVLIGNLAFDSVADDIRESPLSMT